MEKITKWLKDFWFLWLFALLFYIILRFFGYDLKIVSSNSAIKNSESNLVEKSKEKPTKNIKSTQKEPLPDPPADPNQASEEITSTEVDTFIDVYLSDEKSIIVKPYTVNRDKTVSLYVNGQEQPMAMLIKVGGKLTLKNF
ncbi:MAG: hypothetical protein RLZ47_399 [Bacteroidota bacterium]|jgi:cytoskeletal protein RodZ